MNKLGILFKTDLIQNYSLNSLRTKTVKQKVRAVLITAFAIIITIYILIVSGLYATVGYDFLKKYGAQDYLMTMFAASAFITIFGITIYKSKSTIFNVKNNDTLFALPISKTTILINNLINLLITNYLSIFVLLAPATIVYGVKEGLGLSYYLISFISYVFLPFIPTTLASFLGYIVALVSSRAKNKSLTEIFLTFTLFFAIFFVSFNIKDIALKFVNNIEQINSYINKILYPISKMNEAIIEGNLTSLALYILISILFIASLIIIISLNYVSLSSKLRENRVTNNYSGKNSRINSVKTSILIKELKQYISTPIYVLNTAFGVILMLIIAIASIFWDKEQIFKILELGNLPISVLQMVTILVAFVIGMSSTTSSSISLEGSNLWIIKSIPVEIKDIFNSKLLVNLIVVLPLAIISIIILGITLKLTVINVVSLIVFSTVFSILVSQFGLIVNLKWPKLNFISAVQVVKQSLSVMVSIFAMLALILTTILIYGKIGKILDFNIYFTAILIVFICICLIQNKILNSWAVERFKKLN